MSSPAGAPWWVWLLAGFSGLEALSEALRSADARPYACHRCGHSPVPRGAPSCTACGQGFAWPSR